MGRLRRAGLAGDQAGPAGLEELPLPVATDCSDTFARRAASATVTSPATIDSTIRTFSSAWNAGGLAMNDQTPCQVRPASNGPCQKV
jgi:hypothetical protein